jgi:hypothetical protein
MDGIYDLPGFFFDHVKNHEKCQEVKQKIKNFLIACTLKDASVSTNLYLHVRCKLLYTSLCTGLILVCIGGVKQACVE